MITQPKNCRPFNFCPKISHPANTEMLDSRLKIREEIVGFIPFCPITCSVYATPQLITPAYKIGAQAARIFRQAGCSNCIIITHDNNPLTKNWMQESITPSVLGE